MPFRTERRPSTGHVHIESTTLAYVTALIVNFVDQLGVQFTVPVLVPYGRSIGASLQTIALFTTVGGVGAMVSILWMPKLSDKTQRRLVIIISLVGVSCGYFVQGYSSMVPGKKAILVFLIGRGVCGFFSGIQPVLRAYVTELSAPSEDLIKQRLTVLQVASQAAGIVLQPIAGSLAAFGLELPFYCCFGIALMGLVWVFCMWEEADVVKANSQPKSLTARSPSGRRLDRAQSRPDLNRTVSNVRPEGNPFCDVVLLLLFIASTAIFTFMTSLSLLLPLMLELPSFNLPTGKDVARAQGLAAIPFGFFNIAVAILGWLPATKRFGERQVLVVSGMLSAVNYGTFGLWVDSFAKICIAQALGGICFGLLVPSISPLIARHANAHYKKNMAVCQAIALFGMQIAMAFGQNVIADIHHSAGLTASFFFLGCCILVFTLCGLMAMILVERRAPKPSTLTHDQRKVLLQVGGAEAIHPPKDTDNFIEGVILRVRKTLEANRDQFWNGTAQFLCEDMIEKSLLTAIPRRKWCEESHGREYLQDLHSCLQDYPEELEEFREKFPEIAHGGHLWLHGGAAADFHFNHDFHTPQSTPTAAEAAERSSRRQLLASRFRSNP